MNISRLDPRNGVYKNRKCGVNFVYLTVGCGKTRTKINDAIPHT